MGGLERPSELRSEPLRFRAVDGHAVPDASPRLLPIDVALAARLPQLRGWILLGPAELVFEDSAIRLVGLGPERRWREDGRSFELWKTVTIALQSANSEQQVIKLRYARPAPRLDDQLIKHLLTKARNALYVPTLATIDETDGIAGVVRAEAHLADLARDARAKNATGKNADASTAEKLSLVFRLLLKVEVAEAAAKAASGTDERRAAEVRVEDSKLLLMGKLRAYDSERKAAGGRSSGENFGHTKAAKHWREKALIWAHEMRSEDPWLPTLELAKALQGGPGDGAPGELKAIMKLIRNDWEPDGDLLWAWPGLSPVRSGPGKG